MKCDPAAKRFDVTLDVRGPQTRVEMCDAMKAFYVLTGRKPVEIVVPLATYRAWTEWSADEKGSALQAGPPNMEAVPEYWFGLRFSIGPTFRMN